MIDEYSSSLNFLGSSCFQVSRLESGTASVVELPTCDPGAPRCQVATFLSYKILDKTSTLLLMAL